MKKQLLLLFLSLLPMLAMADESGSCGDNVTWTYTSSTGTLTIQGQGAMNNYSSYSSVPWYSSYKNNIKNVVINDGVTSIGDYAFYGCKGLTSITIPNSVTSIGERAFCNIELTSLVVEKGNSKYDSRNNCNAIIETSSNELIAGCKNTVIPNSVTSIGVCAFYNCYLTSITIPNSVTSIGERAFDSCSGLKKVIVPDIAAWCSMSINSNPLMYGHLYSDENTEITDLVIPNSVTSIENNAFYGCNSLTSVTIPNSVTNIGSHAFSSCSGLTSITIPNSVTSIGDWAFYICSGLTSITIPNSVTSIGNNAFLETPWYNNLPDGLVYAGKVAYGYKGTMPSNTTISIKDGTLSITDYAFYYCSGLTSVTIPNSVTSIGRSAFYGCTSLKTINYFRNTPPTGWIATVNTYVPNRQPYSTPKEYINGASSSSIKQMISFDNNEFTYTGQKPTPKWTNNVEGYNAELSFQSLNINAGNYQDNLPATFTKDSKSFVVNIPYNYSIKQVNLTVKAKKVSRSYGEENATLPIEYTGFVNSETEDVLTTKPVATTTVTKTSPVGTYPITVSGGEATNYAFTYVQGELTVSKASLTAKVKDVTKVYGEENSSFDIEYTGFVNSENEDVLTTKPVGTTTATKTSPVGTYPITVSGGEATNYAFTYEQGELTVTKAGLTAKVKDATKVYGEDNPSFDIEYVGLKNGETVPEWTTAPTIQTTATKTSDVGDYAIKANDAVAKNYDLAIADGKLTVTQAPLTITATNASRQYFDDEPAFEYSCTGFRNGDDKQALTKEPALVTEAEKTSAVGIYKITPSSAEAKNYAISYEQGDLAITKRELKATSHCSRQYGEDNPALPIEYTGFVNNETEDVLTAKPVGTTTATTESPVGTYPITVSGGEATNYAFTYEQGELTVTKAGLTAKVKDATKVYGDENPSFDIEYVGLKNGETAPEWTTAPTIQTAATKTSDVGDYAIKANDGVAKNYDLAIADGKLSITQAPLTITATNASRQYFDDEPVFEYSCTGFRNGDDKQALTKEPAIVTEATKTSVVGIYKITPSSAEAKNYAISYEQGDLAITKRELKATSHCSRQYGEDNPALPIEYTGFVNNETEDVLTAKPVGTTTATTESPVGTYPITVSGGESTNYAFTYEQGELTVSKAGLTAKVKDATKVYGDENPSFDIEYVGLKNGETVPEWTTAPTIQTAATKTSDVGDYAIKANDGVAKNYDLAIADGKLTITPAPLTIKANDMTRLYYSENPTLDYTCNGFVNGDDKSTLSVKPNLSTLATLTSNVGDYDIEASGAVNPNYSISYEKGKLSITPRILTASVGNYERVYNEENPAFEVTYAGFVGNEDESIITTKAVATTTATKTSDAGTYPIEVSGGGATNYVFSYNSGTLTINKAEQTISWEQDLTGLKVGEQVELKAESTSGLPVTYQMESNNVAEVYAAGTKWYLDCKADGEVQIVAMQEGNQNYYSSTRIRKIVAVGDITGIRAAKSDQNDNLPTYDTMGRKVQELKKGQLYIRQGKKYVVK